MPVEDEAEGAMLELVLNAHRGNFRLQVACSFASDWTVIFGHSGAGKSTLLRLLAGLDRAEGTRIALDGCLFTDSINGVWLKPGHRRTSLVAQQSALFPHLRSEEHTSELPSLRHLV